MNEHAADEGKRQDAFQLSRYVLEELATAGADVAPLLKMVRYPSLTAFREGGTTLGASTLEQLAFGAIDELSRVVRTRDGLPAPRHADWQLLVPCLLSCRSLRDVLGRMAEFFIAIDGRCGYTRLQLQSATHAELQFDCRHGTRDTLALLLDAIGMANIYGLLRWLVGDAIPVEKIMLPYPEAHKREWVRYFLPFPIEISEAATAICFRAELLDHPVVRGATDFEAHSPDFLMDSRGVSTSTDLIERARLLIYTALRHEGVVISLDMLAERLGKNRETVRRQLKNAGSSYSAIKDSCRRELGLGLLRRTDLQIEDVAARLDFCDSDALRRAVHEWVGMSPTQYRRTRV